MEKENYEILWEQTILPELEKTVSSISFATHVSQIKPVDIKDNKIIFCTSSQLFADTISNQATSGIGGKIRDALLKCTNYITDFSVVVAKDRDEYLKQLDEADREVM